MPLPFFGYRPPQGEWSDSQVEAHWDSVAQIYVEANNRVKDTHDQRFIKAIRRLELHPGCLVLNISSRDCEADDYIKGSSCSSHVINAEISRGLMDMAARLRPQAVQVKIDGYSALPFNDAEFDRVLSLETLEHCAEPEAFLRELHRVSKPESILVLSAPPYSAEAAYHIYTWLFGGHGEGPHRFIPSREVKRMIEECGWVLKHHEGTLLVPVGPRLLKNVGEWLIKHFQNTPLSEMGIRQFYVCAKY